MKTQDTHSKTTRATLAKHIAHTPSQTQRDVERSHGRQGIGRSPRDLEVALAEPQASLDDLQKFTDFTPGRYADDEAASASGDSALAIGPNANADALSALALGGNTTAASNATALGTVAQAAELSSAVGMSSAASGEKSVAFGASATASGNSSTAVGQTSLARGTGSTAFGQGATATGIYSFAWGTGSHAIGGSTVVMGAGATSNTGSDTDGDGNIVIGAGAQVNGTGAGAIVIGRGAFISGIGAVTGVGSIVLGDGAFASADNAVAIGANAMADRADAVSVGRPNGERTILNVAPGDIANPTSTDAVNGGQLHGVAQLVNALQDSLSESGLIDPDTGDSLALTYSNDQKTLVILGNLGTPVKMMNVATAEADTDAVNLALLNSTVEDALSGLTGGFQFVKVQATTGAALTGGDNAVAIGSNANAGITGALAIGTGSSATAVGPSNGLLAPVAVGFNSRATQWGTFSVGLPGNERRITNVANGAMEDSSTDAVNGGQLFDLINAFTARANQMEAQWHAAMAAMQNEIQTLRRQSGATARP